MLNICRISFKQTIRDLGEYDIFLPLLSPKVLNQQQAGLVQGHPGSSSLNGSANNEYHYYDKKLNSCEKIFKLLDLKLMDF